MQHYIDVVQDRSGNVIGGAIVVITDNSTGLPVTVYSDAGGSIVLDTVTTDVNGTFSFYVGNGRYNFLVTKNGATLKVVNDIDIPGDYVSPMSLADAQAGTNPTTQTISASILNAASQYGAFTPTGTISATSIKNALGELDTEKASLADLSASTGSTLVGTTNGGTGSVTRTVASKLNDTVSVLDFGADPTGVADSTTAFSNAYAVVAGSIGGTLLVPKGTYLVSAISYPVSGDFTWINKGYASGINIAAAARNAAQLITVQTLNTSPMNSTDGRGGISITAISYGAQHCDAIYAGNYNYSTNGQGNTCVYADAYALSTSYWLTALHGQIQHGSTSGLSTSLNTESASFSTGGSFFGAIINNTTTVGTTGAGGLSAVAHPSATGIYIQGGNDINAMGGWVNGINIGVKSMRAGGTSILISASALVRSHFETSSGSASSIADILLSANSANGIILNGTYSGSAIRMVAGNSIGWEATGTVKTLYTSATSVLGTTFSGTERFGINLGASPFMQLNSTKVVGVRDTGWTAMTGTTDKASAFATSTVTLAQLAGRVMAMQTALTTHGLLGA